MSARHSGSISGSAFASISIVTPATTDPIERWVPAGARALVLGIAAVLLWQAADSQYSFPPRTPDLLYLLWYTAITLPIHEGGHFLFMPFGRILTIAGGSFWQIAIPLIMTFVAHRTRSFWTWIYCVITGVHMIALNAYVYDAPYRTLPLLGGDKARHDWYNLLIHWQALDLAEPFALFLYYGGVVVGLVGIGGGIWWTVRKLFQVPQPATARPPHVT